MRIFHSFIRYALAILFAYALSISIIYLWLRVFLSISYSIYFMTVIVGFLGVFFPTFILPRQSRVACAVFLLLLGVLYYCTLVASYESPLLKEISKLLTKPQLFLLLFGGLIAIWLHYRFFCSKRPCKSIYNSSNPPDSSSEDHD